MPGERFRALLIERAAEGTRCELRELSTSELPAGDVLVSVSHSSVNYKDALAVTGTGKVVRQFPLVPGIDLAGQVIESSDPRWQPGQAVLVTGCGIGETHWGGLAQRARVSGDWLVPLPEGLSARDAMVIGTAGFTAMLCRMALEEHGVSPHSGPVLVTGAAGGVGSIAVAILAAAGYEVAASTGREETHDYLRALGATEIVDRAAVLSLGSKPLSPERWAGAVDVVGGATLAAVLAATRAGGSVAACGLAGSSELVTTVFPFILRGVNLLGINSVYVTAQRRELAWQRLARELPHHLLPMMSREVRLEEVPEVSREILAGRVRGRIVVNLAGKAL